MPFNGSGTFTRTYTWATEALSPPIAISKLDTQEEDIASALSTCLLRNGTGVPSATMDWNAQRLSNLAAATAANDAVRASQIQAGGLLTLGSVSGADTITGNLTPAITAYTAHMLVKFTPDENNTGATTLNIDTLGALDVQKFDGEPLLAGDLVAGVPALLLLDSGADDFILLNPQIPAVSSTSSAEFGYKGLPQNEQSTDYTCVLADAGKHIHAAVGLSTITIPANASVAYPLGTILTFVNRTGGNISIAITTDQMTLAGTSTAGTRTLANNGIASAMKTVTTGWLISGTGLS